MYNYSVINLYSEMIERFLCNLAFFSKQNENTVANSVFILFAKKRLIYTRTLLSL